MNPFNIRVYALVIKDENILITRETSPSGNIMTKFPGGGLEFGEGLIDALKREVKEELDAEILQYSHFYTTDFFVPSFLNPKEQVIAVYYKIELVGEIFEHEIEIEQGNPNLPSKVQFKWVKLHRMAEIEFSFPIDKHVQKLLFSSYS